MHIIEMLKAYFASTPTAAKYFPVTKSNGEIQGQISQADLVAAVKEALPSILADQSTNFASVLTKNSQGVLGVATNANLASVLGVNRFIGIMPNNTSVKDLAYGRYAKNSSVTGATGYPSSVTGSFIVEVVSDSGDNSISHIWLYDITIPGNVYYNIKWGGSWRGWRKVTAITEE